MAFWRFRWWWGKSGEKTAWNFLGLRSHPPEDSGRTQDQFQAGRRDGAQPFGFGLPRFFMDARTDSFLRERARVDGQAQAMVAAVDLPLKSARGSSLTHRGCAPRTLVPGPFQTRGKSRAVAAIASRA